MPKSEESKLLMTEGEFRVGISFNPGGSPFVHHIKKESADLIDFVAENGNDARCTSLAMTAFEEAAMWAVKSVTKTPRGG